MTPSPSDFQQGYLGKTVVIALTLISRNGQIREQMQRHGVIEAIEEDGIHIALKGVHDGEEVTLPSDPDAFSPAQPGRYRLEETGEIISNPDYFSAWEVHEEPLMNGGDSEEESYPPFQSAKSPYPPLNDQTGPRFDEDEGEIEEEEEYEDEEEEYEEEEGEEYEEDENDDEDE